ncbi:MAG: hypothetical protein MGF17_12395, partial [Trichodesmium sp. MAG_R04]|nr:hypothetical protein [Trichodesmium sp. MAG_R04]
MSTTNNNSGTKNIGKNFIEVVGKVTETVGVCLLALDMLGVVPTVEATQQESCSPQVQGNPLLPYEIPGIHPSPEDNLAAVLEAEDKAKKEKAKKGNQKDSTSQSVAKDKELNWQESNNSNQANATTSCKKSTNKKTQTSVKSESGTKGTKTLNWQDSRNKTTQPSAAKSKAMTNKTTQLSAAKSKAATNKTTQLSAAKSKAATNKTTQLSAAKSKAATNKTTQLSAAKSKTN